jgi:hypothetical protein
MTVDKETGDGVIHVSFGYPQTGIGVLYDQMVPQLLVDGSLVASGWDDVDVPVAAGEHKVMVRLPFGVFKALARADAMVTVKAGDRLSIVYSAPSAPGSRGKLRKV